LAATGFFQHATHPSEGEIMFTAPPVRFSDTPTSTERLQPRLGEHSFEVLREAGFSDNDIKALAASGATLDGSIKAEAAEGSPFSPLAGEDRSRGARSGEGPRPARQRRPSPGAPLRGTAPSPARGEG